MVITIGSVWRKKEGEWGFEVGQLIVVEKIMQTATSVRIFYRYTNATEHNIASWPMEAFLKRMELIKE